MSSELLAGFRARRHIEAGSVIRESRIEETTLIRRGQSVKLRYRTAHLRMESTGRAKQDGNVGDWIEAENLASRRRVMGVVGKDGALHVGP